MAMQLGGSGGVKSDINVTPLVDVMLVLLIIMMIVAPMLQQGVVLTLPSANNTTDKPDTQDQIVVFVDANSKLYVNAVESAEADVIPKIQTALDKSKERVVYLKGDKDAPYSAIMKMMDALRGAQVDTVGLITERPGGNVDDKSKKGGN